MLLPSDKSIVLLKLQTQADLLMYLTAQLNKPGPHAPRWPQQTWGPRATSSDTARHGAPAWILCSPSTESTPRAFSTKRSAPIRVSSKSYSQTRLATSHSPSSWAHVLVPCPTMNHPTIYSGQVASERHHNLNSQPRKKEVTMSSTKRTAQLAKKWQRMAVLGRKRLTWRTAAKEVDKCCTSVASKGHCAVYTIDGHVLRCHWRASRRQSLPSSCRCPRRS
jgi:hypothetical protein